MESHSSRHQRIMAAVYGTPRRTNSLVEALRLSREVTSVSPPVIMDVSYVSNDDWIEDIERTLSGVFHMTPLFRREDSFLHTVMYNGMGYNPVAVLEYLFSRWEGIIISLIRHGVHTRRRYQSLATHLYSKIIDLKRRLTADVETSLEAIDRTADTARELERYLRITGGVMTNISRIDSTVNRLAETRCVSKTPLILADPDLILEDPETGGITLQNGWPELFVNECPDDTSSLDDRKVFVDRLIHDASRWNSYRVDAVTHHAQMAIPSGWIYNSSSMSSMYTINRPGYYPRAIGKSRCRIGLLLAAMDSVATQVFLSYDEYSNWTRRIRDELRAVAGPVPVPPPPPMPAINAEEMTIAEPVAEDDLDPVTLEPFKEGDAVFKMRCCRNKILKESIQGILHSGRAPRCPLCRTGLLV